MSQPLTLSRPKLADFVACQRRFQLRYERQLPWPAGPLQAEIAGALDRGRRFHQLLQRHFIGLPVDESLEEMPELARWWQLFKSQGPELPVGRRLPELSLTAPIGRHFLTGRFDLLVVGDQGHHIYDWKTESRPRSPAALRDDLQTRVYLALVAEGAPALRDPVSPEAITLTYCYPTDPPVVASLAYSRAWHEENWAFLRELTIEIEERLALGKDLPLTDDLAACRRCAYQAYCGRLMESSDLADWRSSASPPQLEPNTP
ncbi:MAG: PD-(D/E)XK nuclease family protein [Chloroflexota bacterium]|nr:MAG: PD-(D/E)XK nuclease family protein [Chloroflexota bacterium]